MFNLSEILKLVPDQNTINANKFGDYLKNSISKNKPKIPSKYKSLQEWIDSEKKYGYDLQGYIDKYGVPDTSGGKHLTDEFKLPNHITFSTDSKYSNDKTPGGVWYKDELERWHYKPSQYVLSIHPWQELEHYFNNYEKDSILDSPN